MLRCLNQYSNTSQNNMNNATELTFEQAMEELEKLVKQMEEGRMPLDEAVKCFERGNVLKNI